MNLETDTRPITTIWDRPAPAEELWLELGWKPMPEGFEPEEAVLRPHILWGPIPMMYRSGKWTKSDLSAWYPPEAFEPYWMPVPKQPMRDRND